MHTYYGWNLRWLIFKIFTYFFWIFFYEEIIFPFIINVFSSKTSVIQFLVLLFSLIKDVNGVIFTLDLCYNKGVADGRWFLSKTGFKVIFILFLTFFKYPLRKYFNAYILTLTKFISTEKKKIRIISVRILNKIFLLWILFEVVLIKLLSQNYVVSKQDYIYFC